MWEYYINQLENEIKQTRIMRRNRVIKKQIANAYIEHDAIEVVG